MLEQDLKDEIRKQLIVELDRLSDEGKISVIRRYLIEKETAKAIWAKTSKINWILIATTISTAIAVGTAPVGKEPVLNQGIEYLQEQIAPAK